MLLPIVQHLVNWDRAEVNADGTEVKRDYAALGNRLVDRYQFAKCLNQLRPIRRWAQLHPQLSAFWSKDLGEQNEHQRPDLRMHRDREPVRRVTRKAPRTQ